MICVKNFKRLISGIFLIEFFLLLLFGISSESELSKRIVVFSIKGSKTIFAAIILLLAFYLTCVRRMKVKADSVTKLLIVRFVLYLIPCFFVKESSTLQIGLIAAVACSSMAYSVGKDGNCTDKFIAAVICIVAVIISLQVLITVQARGLSINSPDLKWWMVIPIGQTNTIGTYFIPMIIVVDGYRNTRKGMFKNILTIIEFCLIASILFMGSRSTLILIGIYLIVRYLVPRAKISKQRMSRLLVFIPIIFVGLIIFLIKNKNVITQFVSQFSFDSLTYTRFKVYQEALAVFRQHLLFGRGAYAYKVYDAVMAHNFVLESLIESGILGSIPFFAALIISLKKMNKSKRMQNTYLYAVVFMLIKALMEPTFYLASFEIFFWFLVGFGMPRNKMIKGE